MRNKSARRVRPAQLESEALLPLVVLTHELPAHVMKKELNPYFRIKIASTPNQLKAALKTADGLITLPSITVNKEILDGAPYLKVIGNVGASLENIDLKICAQRKIRIAYTPDVPTTATEIMARLACSGVAAILQGNEPINEMKLFNS